VKTLLKRAKRSALDIITGSGRSASSVTLLPPHASQIKYIFFKYSHWKDIQIFSEANPGPLPLLHTLRINAVNEFNMDGPDTMTPPSLPLFRNAVNLKVLVLDSAGLPFLHHFVFPNLTELELSARSVGPALPVRFRASQLLDFLEASPMLRTVYIKVIGDILFEGVPRENPVMLPNVEAFSLVVSDGGHGYGVMAHISCPSARHTSLVHERDARNATLHEIFPTSIPWNAIVRQHTRSSVEEVTFEIKFARDPIIECSLTFRSVDEAVLTLDFQVAAGDDDEDELQIPLGELQYEVFHQASRTIRDHPLLANVKRLFLDHGVVVFGTPEFPRFSAEVARLFKSVGPLEKLSTYGCDLYLFFNPSPNPPGFHDTERPVVFPPIRELVISHPFHTHNDEMCMATIVEFARSRHALGIPFERMTVCMERLPTVMAERLGPWVGAVECYEEMMLDEDY